LLDGDDRKDGAMRGASSETWAGVMLLTTWGLLMLSTIVAVCRGRGDRPRFLGFAVFGWGYFALARWYTYHQGPMPTVRFLPGSGDLHGDFLSLPPHVRMAHDAWALAFAVLGSILASHLKGSVAGEPEFAEGVPLDVDAPGWWRKPVRVGSLGFGLFAAAALAGWRLDPQIGAGAAFLMAWALACLAVLGAVLARGRRREAWIGAAAFGIGYLVLAFGPVASTVLPTNHLLNGVFRPGDATPASELPDDDLTADEESRRIRKALDTPISLHFPENTPLKVILRPIKDAIRSPFGKETAIYASIDDVRRLPEQFEDLLVKIDRENIPAKDVLRLCLGQLGLTYRVQSGYVRIEAGAYHPIPFEDDPVMIAGHSLIALIAAAFGGAAAPIVSRLCNRRPLAG
jgi:hypothetical protein